ncbi:hypothetical protein BABINDRAFT_163779 [Babjeviella inositovora NRRL Y-12698]|uniref:U1 small nuclear ribonucleoprotein component SNU71 n=1 Tax=Babjeviella inositovora NRRL Y-12698 TaxID=984486 RepID=A0A1E3QH69_9ASCO|nr:uncharacterized protein BABINDRAFT_163779 [Babjeviella inositovora NRRL Y-12698]ODQ77046.1 hypothetical protein BABINDRAFT_163779 [Babjeviella inositovora NRRL Y-12698]
MLSNKLFDQKVDTSKVNKPIFEYWIKDKLNTYLPDDDIVSEFALNLVTEVQFPDIREVLGQLEGFLEENTKPFCKELWRLLVSAQTDKDGIPVELLGLKMKQAEAKLLQPTTRNHGNSYRKSGSSRDEHPYKTPAREPYNDAKGRSNPRESARSYPYRDEHRSSNSHRDEYRNSNSHRGEGRKSSHPQREESKYNGPRREGGRSNILTGHESRDQHRRDGESERGIYRRDDVDRRYTHKRDGETNQNSRRRPDNRNYGERDRSPNRNRTDKTELKPTMGDATPPRRRLPSRTPSRSPKY